MAILSFMKKAPDLIKQLIPSSGANGVLSYGLSAKDNPGFGMGKAVVGGATAGVVGGVVSGVSRFNATRKALSGRSDIGRGKRFGKSFLAGAGGVITGVGRGAFAGSKKGNVLTNFKTGIENQKKMDNQYENLVAEGGSNLGKVKSKVTDLFTMTRGQRYTMDLANNKKVVDLKDNIVQTANKISVVQKAEAEWQRLKTAGASKDDVEEAYQKMKDLRKDAIDLALGKTSDFRSLTAADINSINSDYESVSYLSTIKADTTELNSHISSRNIELVDGAGERISSIGSYADLDAASISANNNQIRIQSQPDYASAVANDRAAGVHEHRRPPSGQGK